MEPTMSLLDMRHNTPHSKTERPRIRTYYVILRRDGKDLLCSGPLDETPEGLDDFRRQLSCFGITLTLTTAEEAGKCRGGAVDYDNPAGPVRAECPVYRLGTLPRECETADGEFVSPADDPIERAPVESSVARQNRQLFEAFGALHS